MGAERAGFKGLGKVQTGSLRDQVYERLKHLILHNRLSPDQELTMDQIAAELGVSHTPVREALAMLELDGLVITERHRTPRVSPISPADVHEVYEMRILLESWAARKAAVAVSDDEIAEVKEKLTFARREAEHGRFEASMEADLSVHRLVVSLVENGLFQRLYQSVENQSIRVRTLVEARSSTKIEAVLEEHEAIVVALDANDPDLAQSCVASHLEAAMRRTLAALRDPEAVDSSPA